MELKEKLHLDIRKLEEELKIEQDEKAYNDKTDYYLLNRLAELRIIKKQRIIINQGREIMNLDSKHDSEELKKQVENIKEQIRIEEEKNKEYEFQYQNFANIYLGMDNNFKVEMDNILDEYSACGIEVSKLIINKTDEYMFDKYALTVDKLKKNNNDGDGSKGMGRGLQRENEAESDM